MDPVGVAARASSRRRIRSASRGAAVLAGFVAAGILITHLVGTPTPTVQLVRPTPARSSALSSSSAASPGATASPTLKALVPVRKAPSVKHYGLSTSPALSANGRFVAFMSYLSANAAASKGYFDLFVYDRQTHALELASASGDGTPVHGAFPDISADGRYVAFYAGSGRVLVRDRVQKVLRLASASSTGERGNAGAVTPSVSMSDDGRYVAFNSEATNLVPGDTNGFGDIFVHDMSTGVTTRVSISSSGQQADHPSDSPAISGDGRYVTFASDATNLTGGAVPACTDQLYGCSQIFVHDRVTGKTTLASAGPGAVVGDGASRYPTISDDGRLVAFESKASNLGAAPDADGGDWDAFVFDRQTGTVTLTSDGVPAASYTKATVSGSGRLVSFEGGAGDKLYVHNISTKADRLLGPYDAGAVSFSDDDHLIAYGAGKIVVLTLKTGTKEIVP